MELTEQTLASYTAPTLEFTGATAGHSYQVYAVRGATVVAVGSNIVLTDTTLSCTLNLATTAIATAMRSYFEWLDVVLWVVDVTGSSIALREDVKIYSAPQFDEQDLSDLLSSTPLKVVSGVLYWLSSDTGEWVKVVMRTVDGADYMEMGT